MSCGSRFIVALSVLPYAQRQAARARRDLWRGRCGRALSSVLLGGPDFEPVVFIDDKKHLQGSQINGLRVLRPA